MKIRILFIVSLLLSSHLLSYGQVQVVRGKIKDAPFQVQIPKDWNKGLVIYAHGYLPRNYPWFPFPEAMAMEFLNRGFALAESGYSQQGWAVEEALKDTENLRQHFIKEFEKPRRTYIIGFSMGAVISLATLEKHPEFYDGALPMCGPLTPALQFFTDPVFDMLITFEALFNDALPKESKPLIKAPRLLTQVIKSALESDPKLTELFARHWGVRQENLVEILAFYHQFYKEMELRSGGNPIDNRNTVYPEFGDNNDINDLVNRYHADPKALEYARKYYTFTGKLKDPVVAMHTTYDPGVPQRLGNAYQTIASLNRSEDLFVMIRVKADGHCNILPHQMGRAFEKLNKWVEKGVRPEAVTMK